MNLLAIDTSSPACSVALATDSQRFERHRETEQRHSRDLVAMIDALLAQATLAPADLTAIAVGAGPGSFTGVRLGISVAQGLGVALGIPLVPVSSLAIVAQHAVANGHATVVVAQDARMGEVYTGRYVARQGLAVVDGPEQVSAPAHVSLASGDAIAGDAWDRVETLVRLAAGRRAVAGWPRAANLLTLATAALAAGGAVRAEDADASYLRDSVVR